MTLRTNLSPRQRLAHSILDQVKAGLAVPSYKVRWSLVILGDGCE